MMAACFLGAGTVLADVFGPLNYPQAARERKSFRSADVEVVCRLERSEPSHHSSLGCEARTPTAEQAVAKINTRGECGVH